MIPTQRVREFNFTSSVKLRKSLKSIFILQTKPLQPKTLTNPFKVKKSYNGALIIKSFLLALKIPIAPLKKDYKG